MEHRVPALLPFDHLWPWIFKRRRLGFIFSLVALYLLQEVIYSSPKVACIILFGEYHVQRRFPTLY